MPLPYENTSSGDRAMQDVQKILQKFGCQRFGHMMNFDNGELIVQFEHHGLPVSVKASAKGYAAAWLKEHPYSYRSKGTRQDHEKRALAVGTTAIYSILRDWIKGQIMAVETGILTFEGAFLGQIMLPSGQTMTEHVMERQMIPQLGWTKDQVAE